LTASHKKIIIIGPAYPLRGGGMSSFNERLARAFSEEGHKVMIYTFSLQYPSFLFPGKTQLSTEPAPAGLDIKVVINSVNPLNWLKVGNMIRKEKPDIILVRYWLPFMGPAFGTILRTARKNSRVKIVCIADNVIPHEKRPGDELFTRYFLKPVDSFITMSRKVLNDLEKFKVAKPVQLVPHPLYDNFGEAIPMRDARKKLGLNDSEFVLLFFGFIRKYKGLDLLIKAMPDIVEVIPSVKLVIAGEFYDEKEQYLDLIKALNIGGSVLLKTEFIPDHEIRNYFCAADVVVQPYKNATQSGVTPLAYHYGVPMIVTSVGGLPDMVPDGIAGLVAQPDPDSIRDSVIRIYGEDLDQYRKNISIEKLKYGWDKMVDSIINAPVGNNT